MIVLVVLVVLFNPSRFLGVLPHGAQGSYASKAWQFLSGGGLLGWRGPASLT